VGCACGAGVGALTTTGSGGGPIAKLDPPDTGASGGALRAADGGGAAGRAGSIPRSLRADFKRIRESTNVAVPDAAPGVALLAWTALFGAVSFEVFGQYGPDTFTDPALIFDLQMRQIASLLAE